MPHELLAHAFTDTQLAHVGVRRHPRQGVEVGSAPLCVLEGDAGGFEVSPEAAQLVPALNVDDTAENELVRGNVGRALTFAEINGATSPAWNPDIGIRRILQYAEALAGLNRRARVDPDAVVIGDKPLRDFLPLTRDKNGKIAIQYSAESLEGCHFLA